MISAVAEILFERLACQGGGAGISREIRIARSRGGAGWPLWAIRIWGLVRVNWSPRKIDPPLGLGFAQV